MSDRTIAPTPQRRKQAHSEGRFPRSAELAGVATLLLSIGLVWLRGASWLGQAQIFLTEQLRPAAGQLTPDKVMSEAQSALALVIGQLVPFALASLTATVVFLMVQGGFVWAPSKFAPQLSRIGVSGAGAFSTDRSLRSCFAAVKLLVGVVAFAGSIWLLKERFLVDPRAPLQQNVLQLVGPMLLTLAIVAAVVAVLSVGEYATRWFGYERSLYMTPQEAKDEDRGRASVRISPARRTADS